MWRFVNRVSLLIRRLLLVSSIYRLHFFTSYFPGYLLSQRTSSSWWDSHLVKIRTKQLGFRLRIKVAPRIVEISDNPVFQEKYAEAERTGNFSSLVSMPVNQLELSPQQLLRLSHAYYSSGKWDVADTCVDDAYRILRTGQPCSPPESHALLGLDWTGALGHVINIENFIQLRDMQQTPYQLITLLSHSAPQPNRVLLQRIVRSHRDVKLVESSAAHHLQRLFMPFMTPQNRVRNRASVFRNTVSFLDTAAWLSYSRETPSTYLVSDRMRFSGASTLKKWGISDSDEIVCIHVRAGSISPGRGLANADISTYSQAIAKIVDSGRWVIRMGDPHMPPLVPSPRVIDYAHYEGRSPSMDIFLWSRAKFALGTNSGGSDGFSLFHVPIIHTNCTTPFAMHFRAKSFFVPKLYRRGDSSAPLTLEEVAASPWGRGDAMRHADWEDVTVLDNSPDDIAAATDEMFRFLSTGDRYVPESSAQRRLMKLRGSLGQHDRSVISESFVAQHPNLI